MKRILSIASILSLAYGAWAQQLPTSYMYDALDYCTNQYYGTARSMALGNAMTAVGGDLGSYIFNPAGSAVATYSQAVFTPGVTLSRVNSAFDMVDDGTLTNQARTSNNRFNIPGGGVFMVVKTGRESGLKSISFGVAVTQTSNYNYDMSSEGLNDRTSLLAEHARAASASGYVHDQLNSYESGTPYDLVTSYRARLFGGIGDKEYAGNCELISDWGDPYVPAQLKQRVGVTRFGTKNDVLVNLGFNLSDRFYFGFNLGIPTMSQNNDEWYEETPVDYTKFYVQMPDASGKVMYDTYYTGSNYSYSRRTDMRGIYGKFGFIWLPVKFLRVGAAIQTPTRFSVTERISYGASSRYQVSACGASCSSPLDDWGFILRSPYVVDAGVAVTIGNVGLISVDYQMTDYRTMSLGDIRNSSAASAGYFNEVNNAIKKDLRVQHMLRAGAELRIIPSLSARVGFNLTTDPEVGFNTKRFSYSAGLGYSSRGSFYADFAFRYNSYPSVKYRPYYDYNHVSLDSSGSLVAHTLETASEERSPRIHVDRKLMDLALTLGWRF